MGQYYTSHTNNTRVALVADMLLLQKAIFGIDLSPTKYILERCKHSFKSKQTTHCSFYIQTTIRYSNIKLHIIIFVNKSIVEL